MKHRNLISTAALALSMTFAGVACDDGDADPQGNVDASTATAETDTAATTEPADTSEPADPSEPADTTPVDPNAIVLPTERPAVITTASTGIDGWTLKAGQESTRCVVRRLDNAEVMWVSSVRTELADGSHHMIVYKSDETEERVTPFECDPFVETLRGETFPLMITQRHDETLNFPNGVAFKFEPNQMVRIEAHFINLDVAGTGADITASGAVHFDAIAAEDVVSEANMLFYGNPDIRIPPQSVYSTPWRHLSVPEGTEVFAVTGHTHAYGIDMEIAMSASAEDEGTSIYPPADDEFRWDEAPVSTFSPALRFDGTQGFRYRCTWDNDTDSTIRFGESANAEMCFLWAYYYPSDGYRICVNPGSLDQNGIAGDEICCPGHFLCGLLSSQL